MAEALLVITTFPDLETARRISSLLIEEKLVACVNLLPGMESIYAWQGALESSGEALALMKTTAEAWPELARRLPELHPYECPELIGLPIPYGTPAYLQWLAQNCSPTKEAADGPSAAKPQT